MSVAGNGRFGELAAELPPVRLSIEVFPPRDQASAGELLEELDRLRVIEPLFYSVTCGAGGGAIDGTFEVVQSIREHTAAPVAAHLTCIGRTRAEVDVMADRYWRSGVHHLVALRGDPPKGTTRYEPAPDGYAYASDLIEGLARRHDFDISAACYPETHPEAKSADADLDNVARKVDAGASRLLAQYCFDTAQVLRYRDALAARGIDVPLVPGIMPIRNFRQISRFSEMCGAGIPDWLKRLFVDVEPGTAMHQMIAAAILAEQVRWLAAEGFDHLHVYALNRAELTLAVAQLLGQCPTLRKAA